MSNRQRLKPTRPLRTVIIIGEGETEGAFLCHLKALYCERNSGIQIKIEWTYGGSPQDIIQEAIKLKESAGFDRALLLLDTDIPWPSESIQLAQKAGLHLLGSKPCLEGLLLKILNSARKWETVSVKDCKRELHENFLKEDHKVAPEKYLRVFSRDAIELARVKIPELNEIINAMTVL